MIYWTYKHREKTPFLMTKTIELYFVSGSASMSSFERWNPDKPKQHNQTHRPFTEVRLSSKRETQHLNLGCKTFAFYKMSVLTLFTGRMRSDRINILPLGAYNKLNIYSSKNKHRNDRFFYCCKWVLRVRQHFLEHILGRTVIFWLQPGSLSFCSWWPVIVSSFSSLELVGELFAMPVDPDRSSEEASQKSSSCPKSTGDGPNLDIRARKWRSKLSFCRRTSDWLQILQNHCGVLPTKFSIWDCFIPLSFFNLEFWVLRIGGLASQVCADCFAFWIFASYDQGDFKCYLMIFF